MTPAEHKAEAEALLKHAVETMLEHGRNVDVGARLSIDYMLRMAQVHATLATVFDETLEPLPEPIE